LISTDNQQIITDKINKVVFQQMLEIENEGLPPNNIEVDKDG
jgi:hypothetical protein